MIKGKESRESRPLSFCCYLMFPGLGVSGGHHILQQHSGIIRLIPLAQGTSYMSKTRGQKTRAIRATVYFLCAAFCILEFLRWHLYKVICVSYPLFLQRILSTICIHYQPRIWEQSAHRGPHNKILHFNDFSAAANHRAQPPVGTFQSCRPPLVLCILWKTFIHVLSSLLYASIIV